MRAAEKKAWVAALRCLIGAKIVDAGVNGVEEGFPWIELHMPDDSAEVLVISRDDEGNGPGALLGLWDLARRKGAIK